MAYAYDPQNIFAKILRGEIPNRTVMETEHSLAFEDIHPQAPIHVLVIPKGAYVSFDDFATKASDAELGGFARAVQAVAALEGVTESGYRLIANHGKHSQQEVPHYHVHILGGESLPGLIAKT